jgi:hypothetical protein
MRAVIPEVNSRNLQIQESFLVVSYFLLQLAQGVQQSSNTVVQYLWRKRV